MRDPIKKVALIGGGVIGSGWASRFLLNGIDVNIYDLSENYKKNLEKMLANAKLAYSKLTMAPLLKPGELKFCKSIESAVKNVEFVQESVPEKLELKCSILNEIEKYSLKKALICSSTSGIKPTSLQMEMEHPERLMVGHPFNPVYLLPLVEICGGKKTLKEYINKAAEFYREVGMKPLIIRKEIDAFIADRLQEAVWREALWLINDKISTTKEVDDAIRYGFGIRWAQMGIFETYRIAGGEEGMRHFLSQFGPTLNWPWTKLMEVPELNKDLIDKIVEQSDNQSGKYSISELERIRDQNLVGIMQVLKHNEWGAGLTIKDFEERLYKKAHKNVKQVLKDYSKTLILHSSEVRPDWLDYNGHMTESRYLQVFGDATDAFLQFIGMDEEYRKKGFSVYTVETHIRHLKEVSAGKSLSVDTQLLGFDEKRFRIFHVMRNSSSGEILATSEHMMLHVNSKIGKASEFCSNLFERLSLIWKGHKKLPLPEYSGQGIKNLTSSV